MSDLERERRLARRAVDSGVVDARAPIWEKRYRGFVKADELASLGNAALLDIVRGYKDELGAFADYCQRRVDFAMLTGIRVEARKKRIDWAAQLAAADLLATFRGEPAAAPQDQIRELLRAVAAATFVAQAEEAQRGGVEDMVAREDYATAMSVIQSTLAAQPKPKRRLFVLHFEDRRPLSAVRTVLGIHQKTAERWRKEVLAEIGKELEKRGIRHAPGRGGAPRVAVLAALREPEDQRPEGEEERDGKGDEEPDR